MAQVITSKGRKWEKRNSLWILWTFLTWGALNYISFFYAAYRTKQKKWTIWGIIYSIPFILLMIFGEIDSKWVENTVYPIYFIGWVASMFHVMKIRPEYLLRLEALTSGPNKNREIEELRKKIQQEYNMNSKAKELVPSTSAVTSKNDEVQVPKNPIDINLASEEEISTIPHIGVIVAKRIIATREKSGPYASVEDFGYRVSLKPHILEKVRPYVKVSTTKNKETEQSSSSGRIVDI